MEQMLMLMLQIVGNYRLILIYNIVIQCGHNNVIND